ncbi:MAG: hypothetical protein MHPSP_003340, partial [Paramarteilia canceri]
DLNESLEERIMGHVSCLLPGGNKIVECYDSLYSYYSILSTASKNACFILFSMTFVGVLPLIVEQERCAIKEKQSKDHREMMLGTASQDISPLANAMMFQKPIS